MSLKIKAWGARGSIPCADKNFQYYGGATSSFHVEVEGRILIVDLGSGSRTLGQEILKKNKYFNPDLQNSIPILFTHYHIDHIIGLPFFAPMYIEGMKIEMYGAPKFFGHQSLKQVLSDVWRPPYFPITIDEMPVELKFHDFTPGDVLTLFPDLPECTVRTLSLPHPDGCVGYRFDYKGKSIGFLTDIMPEEGSEEILIEQMQGVDILIFDGAFSPEQYSEKSTWGHSSWEYGIYIASRVGNPLLLITHHDILNDDNAIHQLQKVSRLQYENIEFIREGQSWSVCK